MFPCSGETMWDACGSICWGGFVSFHYPYIKALFHYSWVRVCVRPSWGWLIGWLHGCLFDWLVDVHWLVACLVSLVWLIAWCCVLGWLITVLWETVVCSMFSKVATSELAGFAYGDTVVATRDLRVQGKVAVRQAGNGLVCPKGLVILYDIKWYYDQHNADPVASHKFLHSLGFSDAVATIQCTTSVVWRCLKRRS